MGNDRPDADRRRQQAHDPARAARHPGRARSSRGMPVFGYDGRRPRRPRRGRRSTTCGCRRENLIGEEGGGFAHRPGPARAGPHPPLHAADRHGRAGVRADVPTGRGRGSRSASRSPSRAWSRRLDRRRPDPDRAAAAAGAARRAWLIDTVGDRGRRAPRSQAIKIAAPATAQWVIDKAIQVHGAGGVSAGLPAGRCSGPRPARCGSPTARTRCTGWCWPAASSGDTGRAAPG